MSIQYITKSHIARLLFEMRKMGETVIKEEGEIVTADELLTKYYGRSVGEDEAQQFITHQLITA